MTWQAVYASMSLFSESMLFDLSAMINSLGHQAFPTATSPSTRSVPLTTSPGPVDTFIAQDGLGYIQATSPQPTGFALNTAVSRHFC